MAIIDAAKEWPKLLKALNIEYLNSDERFSSFHKMNENHQELYEELEKIFKQYDLSEIVEKLRFSEVTFGILSKSTDHKKDEQFLQSEVLINFSKDSFETENLTINSPVFLKDEPKKTPSRGPDLGEHSKEILSGIGIDSNELDKLKEDGIIDF